MKLFLIRHGQTTANLNQIYAGQTDVPLTDLGRQQAEAIRPVLAGFSFDKVFSSDLSRAIDTQRLALPGAEGERTALLREFDVGSLEGQGIAESVRWFGNAHRQSRDYSVFGGESAQMVCARLQQFLAMLEAEPCDCAAAFVHNGVMNCMLQIVLGGEYDRTGVKTGNCGINVFEYENGKWKLLAWNYMGKL